MGVKHHGPIRYPSTFYVHGHQTLQEVEAHVIYVDLHSVPFHRCYCTLVIFLPGTFNQHLRSSRDAVKSTIPLNGRLATMKASRDNLVRLGRMEEAEKVDLEYTGQHPFRKNEALAVFCRVPPKYIRKKDMGLSFPSVNCNRVDFVAHTSFKSSLADERAVPYVI